MKKLFIFLSFLISFHLYSSEEESLKLVKLAFLDGNLSKAKAMLMEKNYTSQTMKLTKKRYLSMLYFIEGAYEKSLSELSDPLFSNDRFFTAICSLKTLDELILNKINDAKTTWKRCHKLTVIESSYANQWPNILFELKNNKEELLKKLFVNLNLTNEPTEIVELYLKLALYTNQTKLVLPSIDEFHADVLENTQIRELIGLIYYNEKMFRKAYEYIDDLKTPNVEVIKGNLYLAQEKYELAYGQYKIAIQKKINSKNAIDRAIPLAWLLKQWKEGISFLENSYSPHSDHKNKASFLKIQFHVMDNNFEEAYKLLNQLNRANNYSDQKEFTELYAITTFYLGKDREAETFSRQACKNESGVQCFMAMHFHLWDNYSKTLKRDDSYITSVDEKLQKYYSPFTVDLRDELRIKQKEIEELDEKDLKITSSP